MRRVTAATILALLVLVLMAAPATAARRWCFKDPIVTLNGTEVKILVGLRQEDVPLVNGPVQVEIRTPGHIRRELIFTDNGFNGYGETVRFTDLNAGSSASGSFPVEISVSVPVAADSKGEAAQIPVSVLIIPSNAKARQALGTSIVTRTTVTIEGLSGSQMDARPSRMN